MEKPKNLYVQPMDMNLGVGMWVEGEVRGRKGKNNGATIIAYSIKYILKNKTKNGQRT